MKYTASAPAPPVGDLGRLCRIGRARGVWRPRSLAVTAGLVLAASLGAQPPAQRRDPGSTAGCYRVSVVGPWSGVRPLGFEQLETPPQWARLDTLTLNPYIPRFAVRPDRVVADREGFASWTPLGRDSLEITWATRVAGHTVVGVRLALGIRGDSLVGTARAFSSDVRGGSGGSDPQASVVLTRTRCAG